MCVAFFCCRIMRLVAGAGACGPFDLASMRDRTFRLPLDAEGFGLMFRICEDIPTAELPYTCQPEVIGDA